MGQPSPVSRGYITVMIAQEIEAESPYGEHFGGKPISNFVWPFSAAWEHYHSNQCVRITFGVNVGVFLILKAVVVWKSVLSIAH